MSLIKETAEYHDGMWIMTLIQWTVFRYTFFLFLVVQRFWNLNEARMLFHSWKSIFESPFHQKNSKKIQISWLATYVSNNTEINADNNSHCWQQNNEDNERKKKFKIYTNSFHFVHFFNTFKHQEIIPVLKFRVQCKFHRSYFAFSISVTHWLCNIF